MEELVLQVVPFEQSVFELQPHAPMTPASIQTGASPPQPVLEAQLQAFWVQVSPLGQSVLAWQLPQMPPEQPGLSKGQSEACKH